MNSNFVELFLWVTPFGNPYGFQLTCNLPQENLNTSLVLHWPRQNSFFSHSNFASSNIAFIRFFFFGNYLFSYGYPHKTACGQGPCLCDNLCSALDPR